MAKIPLITTGIKDFMINSGLKVPIPAIPIPDLAVPMAAPKQESTMAAAQPANPKKGAYNGAYMLLASCVDMFTENNRMDPFLLRLLLCYIYFFFSYE